MDTMSENMLHIQLQLWYQLDQFIASSIAEKDTTPFDECKIIALNHEVLTNNKDHQDDE
jgi:hypothetical protein